MVLESFKEKLKKETIWWFTDNQNVVRIVQPGSPKPLLKAEALSIFSTRTACHILIEPEWYDTRGTE